MFLEMLQLLPEGKSKMAKKNPTALFACLAALSVPTMVLAWTVGSVPADGVYRFTFGVNETSDGSVPVPASAIYDVQGTGYYDGTANATFSYGFLGTTENSYKTDVPVGSKVTDVRQIDGFSVVEGQYIVLSNATDLTGLSCVCGPAKADYRPANASPYEGRYPVRFAMRAEERAYYAVTCTVANASSFANADVTLYSERSHLHAHHMVLAPGETRTFAWSVELAPNFCKAYSDSYRDNAINVIVVGENAALASLTVVKQPQIPGTVRGEAVDNMNVGKSIWICTDSTGCDYPMSVPFFSLQNYGGVGAGLSRWAPANISICNQGEGGLATNSKTHRQSCLLKPDDYLYVEYGHNESSVASYTNNLEAYLTDAKTAGAKLLVVSPVERHTSWNSTTKYWEASLAGIRDGGRAWVEDKIAQGETCVAFIDLNTHYLSWMNSEVDRICERFPSMNRSAAINYYYQSAKGKNVDGTHLNTAGEDQGAYAFWQAALAIVAAGESAQGGTSAKIQADVVKGITEGFQSTLGLGTSVANTPWLVTDEIIEAGVAPNSFWDTPVTTMLDYVNEAVVADVAAWTNADGTVTISNITMRILNPGNYYKAVVDVVSADAATTNRYYSYYNYDVGGLNASSGTLINPEQPGFIDSDRAAGSAKDRETLTVPVGGKAFVWFAKADDATWQVGANPPCSAKYPVEAWSRVLVCDNGDDASIWSAVTQSEYTFTENEDGYYDFTGTGYGSDGKTKKNFGMFHDFDEAGEISGGRYRVSFKALYTAGSFTFGVIKAKGTTTSPTGGAVGLVQFTSKSAKVCGSEAAEVTLVKDANEELQPSNRINVDAWTDVDMIVDMDLGTAEVSVGGSDYQTYEVSAYSQHAKFPGEEIPNLPYRYFYFSLESQMSHFGAIDDIRVMQLAASTERQVVSLSAAPNNAEFGSVSICGESTSHFELYAGNDFVLKAASANRDLYAFVCWRDALGNDVSSNATFVVENAVEDGSYTAVFRRYGMDEARVVNWDFSSYIVDGIAATGNQTVDYDGLGVFLQSGDSMTTNGLFWANVGSNKSGTSVGATGRHIEWTAPYDGSVTITFRVGSIDTGKKVYPYLMVATNEQAMATSGAYAQKQANAVNTDLTLTFDVTAGTLYKIYAYYYNRNSTITITDVAYTYAYEVDVDTHKFVWNPDVAEGAWNNPANWLYDGIVPASTYPNDVSRDVAVFNSAATVMLASGAYASNVTFNANATLADGTLSARLVDGDGAVRLANAGFANPSNLFQTNKVAIVMTAGTTNWFNTVGDTEGLGKIYIQGNISGEGCYKVQLAATRQCNAYFQGDNNGFQGEVYTSGGTLNRTVIQWGNSNAAGTNAYWHIGHSYGSYNSDSYRMGASVMFGGYDGAWWDRYDNNTLTIGYLNRDSKVSIYNGVGGRANNVTKVGAANLTLGTKLIKNLTVNGGSVTMPIGIAPKNLTIAVGTKIKVLGDPAWTAGTVTNLFSYTTLGGSDVTAATLPRFVTVDGLAKRLKARIAVADGTVTATIVEEPGVAFVLK